MIHSNPPSSIYVPGSLCTTSLQDLFGLPHGMEPSTLHTFLHPITVFFVTQHIGHGI